MVSDRGWTDKKSFGNLSILEPLCNETDHLSFSLRERRDFLGPRIECVFIMIRHLPQQVSQSYPIEPGFTSVDLLNCFQQQVGSVFLQDHSHRAKLSSLLMCLGIA